MDTAVRAKLQENFSLEFHFTRTTARMYLRGDAFEPIEN